MIHGRTTDLTECEYHSLAALTIKQDKDAEKYGPGILFEDTNYDWIEECIEELADGLQYAVAAKMRRELYGSAIVSMLDTLSVTKDDIETIESIKEMLELI